MFANSAVLSRLSALEAALDADLELERRRAAESAATALADEEAVLSARRRHARALAARRAAPPPAPDDENPLVRLAAAGTLNARTERYQRTLELRADATAFYGGDYGFGGHRFKGEEPRAAAMTALANAAQDDAAALHAARRPALHSQRQKAAANNVRNTMRHLGENVPPRRVRATRKASHVFS